MLSVPRKANPPIEKVCAWTPCSKKFIVPYSLRKRVTCSGTCRSHYTNSRLDKKAAGEAISRSRREGIASGRISTVGHPHSEETRRRLSEISSGGKRSGINNGMFGRRHTAESREAMSQTRTRKIVNGEYDKSKWAKRGEIWAEKAKRLIPYRSSWERRAIEMLEADPDVSSFRFEPVRIQYYYGSGDDTNHKRHYVPDFIVEYTDGRRVMIEIKPLCYVDSAVNVAKAAAAREYCEEVGLEYRFWTQRDLGV